MTNPLKTWLITRHELVYYDALRLQWQLFQNRQNEKMSDHRKYIQQLLSSGESWLQNATYKSRIAYANQKQQRNIVFDKNDIPNHIIDLCNNSQLWECLIEKLLSLAKDNFENSSKLRYYIQKISTMVMNKAKNPLDRKTSKEPLSLPYETALDLLSILPIRRHWDTYGCWAGFNPLKSEIGEKQDIFVITEQSLKSLKAEGVSAEILVKLENLKDQKTTDEKEFFEIIKKTIGDEQAIHFISLFVRHGKYTYVNTNDSYVYINRISFNTKDPDNNAKSTQLLNYEVKLEILRSKLNQYTTQRDHFAKKDFFYYCYYPGEDHFPESPDPFYGQKELYQFYAYFNDTIFKYLGGGVNKSNREKNNNLKTKEIFLITYPLITLGRKHYFQIYLTQLKESQEQCDLERLWWDWQEIHEKLNWPEAKVCLAEDIEQIDLSLFQSRVNKVWPTQYLEYSNLPEDAYKRLICHYGPLLFPVANGDRFNYGETQWEYGYDRINDADGNPIVTWSHLWEIDSSNQSTFGSTQNKALDKLVTDEGISFSSKSLEIDPLHDLHRGRRKMILQQQIKLSTEINKSLMINREEERVSKMHDTKTLIGSLPIEDKDQLLTQLNTITKMDKDSLLSIPITPNKHFRELMSPWVKYPNGKELADWRSAKEALKDMLKPTITELASEYFEVGVIKHITHSTYEIKYFLGSIDKALEDIDSKHSHLINRLDLLLKKLDGEVYQEVKEKIKCYKEKCEYFHKHAVEHVAYSMDTSATLGKDRKKEHRFKFHWEFEKGLVELKENSSDPSNENDPYHFETNVPLDSIVYKGFTKFSEHFSDKANKPKLSIFSFPWIKHTNPLYLNKEKEPYLHRHCLTSLYPIDEQLKENIREGKDEPEFITLLWDFHFAEFGKLYVRLEGEDEFLDLTTKWLPGQPPNKVDHKIVIPYSSTKLPYLNKNELFLIFIFDSWKIS